MRSFQVYLKREIDDFISGGLIQVNKRTRVEMEVLRRRKDGDKSKQEVEQEKAKEEEFKHASAHGQDTSSKIAKDHSLEKLLHQQLKDWEREKIETELDAMKERPTLQNIELPNLKPAAFSVYRALHEISYPAPKDVVEDLEYSGIPVHIQERFQIGFIENLKDAGQFIAPKFKPEELSCACFQNLSEYAKKDVPVLVFPYFRDDEICFISFRALVSNEERDELDVPRYVRLGDKIPFPYNANVFTDILGRERKKVFFLYPSRYRLNILSKEEDVLVVAEKGFDAIAIREFVIEEEWYKLFVDVEPVIIIDPSDRTFPNWQQKVESLNEEFKKCDMIMRLEILPDNIDVPSWFVKSNLGERKLKLERPSQRKKSEDEVKEWGHGGIV
jgi:hypothetical protein